MIKRLKIIKNSGQIVDSESDMPYWEIIPTYTLVVAKTELSRLVVMTSKVTQIV